MPDDDMVLVRRDDLGDLLHKGAHASRAGRSRLLAAVNGEAATERALLIEAVQEYTAHEGCPCGLDEFHARCAANRRSARTPRPVLWGGEQTP